MMKKHQDYIYEKEDYYTNPKETFLFLKKLISNQFEKGSILDIGCARGEFLYYMKENFKYDKLVGIDYRYNLINHAKDFKQLSEFCDFYVNSAEEFKLDMEFDIITMSGVLSYFDDINLALKRIQEHLKVKGRAYILGFFNDDDIDVIIRYKNNEVGSNTFESGWNLHSLKTIKNNLKSLDMSIIDVHKFDLSFKLLKSKDAARSWHIDTEIGRKFVNGLGLMYDMRVIEIVKN